MEKKIKALNREGDNDRKEVKEAIEEAVKTVRTEAVKEAAEIAVSDQRNKMREEIEEEI